MQDRSCGVQFTNAKRPEPISSSEDTRPHTGASALIIIRESKQRSEHQIILRVEAWTGRRCLRVYEAPLSFLLSQNNIMAFMTIEPACQSASARSY
jgi:hypothetical protein